MNKSQLIDRLAEQKCISKAEAKNRLESVLDLIQDGLLQTGSVVIAGFAKFEVVEKAARNARNPKTGEAVVVPAKKAIKFKAYNELTNAVK